ncbi:hypothetical protein [Cohnella soli]|uniref:Carboxypeptidase regulatory-like domain-containing protein n=1 Tax=Cohnella soli TaxID=425005 RepID=A0ABW0HXN5_9BACL
MTATLKVKHLVLLFGALLAVFLLLQYWIVPKVQMSNVKKEFVSGAPTGKAAMKRAIDRASGGEKWSLIRKYVIENGNDFNLASFDVTVGGGWYYAGGVTTLPHAPRWTEEEKVEFLKAYVDGGPVDGYLSRAARQLGFAFEKMGRDDDALGALEIGEKRLEESADGTAQARVLKLDRAKIHARNFEYANATKLLDELAASADLEHPDNETEIARLRARILLELGEATEAYKQIAVLRETEIKQGEEKKKNYPELEEMKSVSLMTLTEMEALLAGATENEGSSAIVSGVAQKSDGSPLVGIGVYLRQSSDSSHSLLENEPYQTLTDAKGRYSFRGVVSGSYQLAIGVSYEQIDGWTYPVMNNDWIDIRAGQTLEQNITLKPLIGIQSPVNNQVISGGTIKFKWEPVGGAAYYALNGTFPYESGGFSNPRIVSHIKGSEADIPLEQIYESFGGFSYRTIDGKNVPDPTGLLGFANPESRLSWYVEAYDKNGRLITRSNGYRLDEKTMGPLPFFYLKARVLTAADRLLLDGKLDEALASYKKEYESNSSDRYSLQMIIRLYDVDASINRTGKWPEEAFGYAEKLIGQDDTGKYALMLFMQNFEIENWKKAEQYYSMYRQSELGQADEGYAQSMYAKALLKQGKFKEAYELFAQALEADYSHRFVGYSIALHLVFSDTFDSAIAIAEKYPERDYYESSKSDWSKMTKALQVEEAREGGDYRDQLRKAIRLAFEGDQRQDELGVLMASHPAMKSFVQAVENIR